MSPTQRRLDPSVAEQLLAEPHRFGFFQAVRILEQLFVRAGVPIEDVVQTRVRFRNTLNLAFPPSEIETLKALSSEGDVLHGATAIARALLMEEVRDVELTPAFMGLLGSAGVLPLNYTDRIAERELFHRDRAAREFLDIFCNRAVALYYAAWKKYRPHLQYERDSQRRFLPLALALAGVGLPAMRNSLSQGKGEVFDQSIAHYSGGIRQRPVSATFMQRMLADYFRVPLRVEQFAGAWYAVPKAQCTRLGVGNAALGSTALAGERVWQRDLRARIWIGPLSIEQFESFLPGGHGAAALAKWLCLLTGVSLEYEVRLILRAEDVRGAALNAENGGRLGWDAFVSTQPSNQPRSDARYAIHTLH